jgi:hypothetical protein
MPVKTMEATLIEEQPKTFKEFAEPSGQEYHYLHRTVGPYALPDGTMTGDMLDIEVMNWMGSGYRIHTVHTLGQHKGAGGELLGYVYGFHLVKG